MEKWVAAGACDGFMIMAPYVPGSLEDFVRLAIPELQRRGLFRTSYSGDTLRSRGNALTHEEPGSELVADDGTHVGMTRNLPIASSAAALAQGIDSAHNGDCGKGVCECGHDGKTPEDYSSGHWCAPPGNCRVDADCGAGNFCSASHPLCSRGGGHSGFYCHTSKDECWRDEDCPRPEKQSYFGTSANCQYAPQRGRWVCMQESCPVG